MRYKQLRWFFCLVIVLLAARFLHGRALAQSSEEDIATIEIAQVDNAAFPDVTLYVRVLDEDGVRVPYMSQDQFNITEDGKSVDIVSCSRNS